MSSILDVANEANVATSTVSRVINGSTSISAKTQKRVQEAVRRLGYIPRGKETRSRQQRAWHLGVVYSPWMVVNGAVVEVCRDWIIGIKQKALESGGHLEIFPGTKRIELDTMYRHSQDNNELHGVILLGAMRNAGYYEDARTRKLPVVAISDRSVNSDISCVYADMYNAGKLAMEHLLSLGHRRIAMGHLPSGILHVSDLRHRGAIETLAKHGLSPAVDKRADPDFDDMAYFDRAARDMVNEKVTALFCSDHAAVRYIEAFDRLGLAVPSDISVVGCDNSGLLPKSGLSLTTITYDKIAMGRLAATTLMQIIRQHGEIQHVETSVPTHLVINKTTAKAGKPMEPVPV